MCLDIGYLYNFTMDTATNLSTTNLLHASNEHANWVERCSCSKEYDGEFCEICALGYKRVFPFIGATGRCVPCECNEHSKTCDAESGKYYVYINAFI